MLFGGPEQPGPIVDTHGKPLGQHRGIVHYTVGQRKGLGLSGTIDPLYVVRIEACSNTVVVGTHKDLFATRLIATDLNWISVATGPQSPLPIQAKIRQQHKEADAVLQLLSPGDRAEMVFAEPQMSITPGQTVVFYDQDRVVGSGVIADADQTSGS